MSSLLRRKAEPELISRKASSGSSAAKAGPASASPAIAAFASRSSAVQQIHRSLKAWRDEDKGPAAKPAEADKSSDEKVDDGAKDAKSAAGGGEQTNANKNLAQDDGAKQAGAEGTEAKADSAGSAPGAEAAPAAAPEAAASEGEEVKEEAPGVGTKLKVLAKRKDLSPAKQKEKEEEQKKQKELCLAKVELAKSKATQMQQAIDLVAGLGVDALLTLAGPAAPVLMPIVKTAVGIVQDGTCITLDAKRDFQANVISMAINTMSSRQIRTLANNWTKVEPSLADAEARLKPQLELLKTAGLTDATKPMVGGITKGVAVEGGKKVAESLAEKWIPFVGTLMKVGELIATVKEIGDLREKIEELEKELA